MAIGTRGDIDTDTRYWCFPRYEEYEDDNGTLIYLLLKSGFYTTEYSKGVYVDKEYVSA
ncbi:MAG: hypothetical protein ACLUPK_02905 [Veillonella sp.]